MESKMNEFIKITEGEKVALIDPVGKVCLGVSKRFADNLDKPEFQEKLFPVWKQQTEFIKEILQGWVMDNLTTMFTDVNDKVGTIAGEVGRTPSSWNSGVFSMIENLSENVMIPIAGMIISFVLVYELISMVIDKNNLHDFNTAIFIRFFMKACIAVMLLSKTFDIVMAVFDVGSHIVNSAASAITGSTSIDVSSTLQTMFNEQFSDCLLYTSPSPRD